MPAPSASTTSPLLVHAALCFITVLLGANYVVAKVAMLEVAPLDLVVIRTWGTAALLFGAWRLRESPEPAAKLTRSDLGQLALYSVLGASINQICFLEGLARSTATNASIILVSIPLFALAFAVVLGRERLSPTTVLGIAIGLSGAVLLIVPRGGVDVSARAAAGNLLLLLGGTSYALYLVLTRPILTRHDPVRIVTWVFAFAAVTVLPIGVTGLPDLMRTGVSRTGWISVAYVVVGGTTLPYLVNNWALARVKSSLVAVYILLQPVVAVSLGRVFLHEQVGRHTATAALLVAVGVGLSAWPRPATRRLESVS